MNRSFLISTLLRLRLAFLAGLVFLTFSAKASICDIYSVCTSDGRCVDVVVPCNAA